MDSPGGTKRVRINRLLPYWAVFQADVHLTLRSWVYRTWVLVSVLAAVLAAVVSCGVTVSAMVNSTVLGIAILWFALYGSGFALSLLPARIPSPDRLLSQLPDILRGYYNIHALGRVIGWSAVASCC